MSLLTVLIPVVDGTQIGDCVLTEWEYYAS